MKNQMIRTLESFDHEIATDIIRYSIKQRVVTADLLSSDPNCSVLNQYIKASVGYEYTDNYELNLNDVFPRNPPLTHTLTGEQNRFVNKDEAFVFNKIVIKGKEFLQIKTVGTVEGEFCFFNASTGNFCEVFKNVKTKEDLWLSYGADNLTPQIFYFAKEAMIKDKLINFSILKKMDIQ